MRIIADTNVVVSGLLWGGAPNQILKWARDGRIQLLVCEQTVAELKRVLHYQRFSKRLSDLDLRPSAVLAYFMNLAVFVEDIENIPRIIKTDAFDNVFLALAERFQAKLVISGDQHLLKLKNHRNIPIVTPAEAVQVLEKLWKSTEE